MRSSFFGLNVAVTGLFTAQRNLYTTGHNVSNAAIDGYSRQMTVSAASSAMKLYNRTGMVGTGSEVLSVVRIRDIYLDAKYRYEKQSCMQWDVKASKMSDLQRIFGEPSSINDDEPTGGVAFNSLLDQFYTSLEELSKDVSDVSNRTVLSRTASTMVQYFNSTAVQLERMQKDLNEEISLKVDEFNQLINQIGKLNKQIYILELDGENANDCRDERDRLVDKLSGIAYVETHEMLASPHQDGKRDDVHFVVTMNGRVVVDHYNVYEIECVQRKDSEQKNAVDLPGLFDIYWKGTNPPEKVGVGGGELQALIDVRDGNGGQDTLQGKKGVQFKGVPYYLERLNEFVQRFALAFNEGISYTYDSNGNKQYYKLDSYTGHANGFGIQAEGMPEAPTGIRFFTEVGYVASLGGYRELSSTEFMDGVDLNDPAAIGARYENITAKNFRLSDDIVNSAYGIYNIAASALVDKKEDNSLIKEFLNMRQNTGLFAEGTPEDYMRSLIAALGIDTQQAIQLATNQEKVLQMVQNKRLSISQVSVNEESSNMVRYNQAYQAAARMISVFDDIYTTLINKVGRAGI